MNGQQRGNPRGTGGQRGHGDARQGDQWAKQLGERVTAINSVNAEAIVSVAEQAGNKLAKEVKLKMNQIRRFLTELREIESIIKRKGSETNWQERVILLRPKLAYAAGRQKEVRPLLEILDPAIKSVSGNEKAFQNLLRLVEGIVAYHRAAGGDN